MPDPRRSLAVLLGCAAAAAPSCSPRFSTACAATYGAGPGTSLTEYLVLPLALGLATAATWGWGRWTVVLLTAFAAGTVAATMVGGAAGARAKEVDIARGDREFTCTDQHAGAQVDERVDEAFRSFDRPAPLYGPIDGTRFGCTAAVYGAGTETLGPAPVPPDSGWHVVRDRHRVVVSERHLTAVLTSTEAPRCSGSPWARGWIARPAASGLTRRDRRLLTVRAPGARLGWVAQPVRPEGCWPVLPPPGVVLVRMP